jgi:myo-inositol-1(or 4)-monophosphatase
LWLTRRHCFSFFFAQRLSFSFQYHRLYTVRMDTQLQTAIEAARRAGDLLLRKLPLSRQVRYKGQRDIVTDADEAAQQLIAEIVRERFPKHAFLGEEGQAAAELHSPGPTWIVDPLDGTTNYARRYPSFCVSVALAEGGSPRVGAIFDPARRELFYAEAGQGAFFQRGRAGAQPLRVSATTDLAEALVGVDWARDPALRARTIEAVARVAAACRTVRASGSAALGLAYVAAGWLDAYYNLMLAPWDVAAGVLIIREAGGVTTSLDGQSWELGQPALLVSSGRMHSGLVETLAFG